MAWKRSSPRSTHGLRSMPMGQHVAQELLLGLLERHVQAPLAARARGPHEMSGGAGLAAAGHPADEHRRAAIVALTAEHGVEPRDAGRHPLARHLVPEPDRRHRQHGDAVLVDQERVLVGAVVGAAVLDDPQPARRHLLAHPVVEHDDAVGHVLLEALAGELPVALLAGDDRGDAPVLEPAEQPPQLRAQDRLVGEAAEQGLDGVEHDPLGLDAVDRVAEPHEQPLEVVVAGLLDLAALDDDVREPDLLLGRQLVEVEAERADVLGQLPRRLLEREEHPGLAELRRAADQELHGEQGLAAPGGAADERRPAEREAAPGHSRRGPGYRWRPWRDRPWKRGREE